MEYFNYQMKDVFPDSVIVVIDVFFPPPSVMWHLNGARLSFPLENGSDNVTLHSVMAVQQSRKSTGIVPLQITQDGHGRFSGGQHYSRAVTEEAHVTVVVDQMPWLVAVSVLEAVLSCSNVGRFANVTAVKL